MLNAFLETISLLVGFSCIILAIFLFLARADRKLANQFFGAFLLLTAIDISGWVVMGHGWGSSWLEAFRSALSALQMPLFLGFIASSCYSDFNLKKRDIWHAVPFVIGLYLTLPGNQLFWGLRGENVQATYLTNTENAFTLITSHVQYYLYIAATVVILWRFRDVFQKHYADARSDVFNWLSQLVAVSIFAHTLLLVRHIAILGEADRLFQTLQAAGALIVLGVITWITFKALMEPQLFRGVDRSLLKASSKRRSNLSDVTGNDLEEHRLLSYMDTHQPYFDADLTLQSLADQLALTPRELSELINGAMEMHFFDFVNSYRVRAAAELLLKDRAKTILEVLYHVGFNSKSSFNTAFKKHVQMTPTEYRRANPGKPALVA